MDAPAYWISALAEELALLSENGDSIGVSVNLREHARIHAVAEGDLAHMIAREWDQTGVRRAPGQGFLRVREH